MSKSQNSSEKKKKTVGKKRTQLFPCERFASLKEYLTEVNAEDDRSAELGLAGFLVCSYSYTRSYYLAVQKGSPFSSVSLSKILLLYLEI